MAGDWMSMVSGGLGAGSDVAATMMQNASQEKIAENANKFSQAMANSAMNFSANQAEVARDYDTTMANSAHQREVADLRAAGLNPILAAGGGGSSSPTSPSPSGVSATGQQYQVKGFQGIASSALGAMAQQQALANAEEQENLLHDQDYNVKMDTINKQHTWKKIDADIDYVRSQTEINRANARAQIDFNELLDSGKINPGLVKGIMIARQIMPSGR